MIFLLINQLQLDKGVSIMKRGYTKNLINGALTNYKDKKTYGPLGDLIRKTRIELKLGLADLAKSCECSVQFISNIEHGRAPLPWDKASALAKTLKIPVNKIQVANLSIRSDLLGFIGVPRKKSRKLDLIHEIASSLSLIASDSSLQDLLRRYNNSSDDSRKSFIEIALKLLN